MFSTRAVLLCHASELSSRALHYGVLSCHVSMSCLVWSWLVLPCLSYLALPCRVMYCIVFSCLALPCLASPRRNLPCLVMVCFTLPRRVSSRDDTTCHVVSGLVCPRPCLLLSKFELSSRGGPRGSLVLLRLNFGRQGA